MQKPEDIAAKDVNQGRIVLTMIFFYLDVS